jgi:hypothetical protein
MDRTLERSSFDGIAAVAVVLSEVKDPAVDRPGNVGAGDPCRQQA